VSDGAEYSKSGWRFVALFRFEQTNKDGKKVFFNFQAVPSSTSKEILSIFRQHSDSGGLRKLVKASQSKLLLRPKNSSVIFQFFG